eukprot:maker-scaffold36_size508890-snap-gene-3.2 protein:Tk03710 transcript:maker-scaffold36_size508890-snap-gene-3.2-mRNA-1 annotation:"transcriptional regulator"
MSAREGGGDSASNPRLRAAIDKALSGNMKRDTVEQAIKRGTGELEGVDYEEIRYEGYAPAGVAILVETTTDNRNRTVSEVRHAFNKYGGNMGTEGSVSYLFERVGSLYFDETVDEDELMNAAIEAGADDVIVSEDGSKEVITNPDTFLAVQEALEKAGFKSEQADIIQKPGGGDSASNPRLRAAIDKALAGNMKRDTVEQAIKRGTGELEGVDYEEIRYEGYAPAGVAILVETTTDNRNRTVSEVRHAFNKYGGNMGTEGSVSYLFERVGSLYFDETVDEDELMNAAIEAGADDVIVSEDGSKE